MMSLAQRVRDFRYTKGWGPDELASRAAISRTALYQIESGKTELPRAGTLRRIALALEVSMESLLGHGDPDAISLGPLASAPARARAHANGGWIPSEGGLLATPPPRPGQAIEGVDALRFGVEAQPSGPPTHDGLISPRERELAWKLHELLASPLGEGVARIVE